MSNGPVEPSADLRDLAHALFETYTALVNQGFTEQQALTIVGQMLTAGAGGQK